MAVVTPSRFKLEGVPPIGFYSSAQKLETARRCPENIPIPAAIRAVMEYCGAGLGCYQAGLPGFSGSGNLACGYAFLTGVSGAAFYTCWDERWQEDCVSIIYLGHDYQTAEVRCFEALGYSFEWVLPKESTDTHSDWLERIAGSLYENNMPVFSYGIIGPPEPSIITGWDKDGEILTGWSFFQSYLWQGAGDFEPDGQFRKRGWLEGNLCLLVIGQKKPRPELSATFRSALEWGLQVYRTPKVFPEPDAPEWVATKWNGRAALQAWEASLLDDTNFPAGDDATLRHRHTIINSVAGNLAEARSMADVFLQQIAAIIPAAAPDLIHAGKLYQAEHDLVYRLWNICPGLDRPDAALKLPDAGLRRDLAAVIAEMRGKEEEAVQSLEAALQKWASD